MAAVFAWAAIPQPPLGLASEPTSGETFELPVRFVAAALDRYVFVANRGSAEIAMIDTGLDQVVGQVTLAGIPHQYVLSETHAKLVASHPDQDRLTIFDVRAMAIADVLSLDFPPELIEIDPNGEVVAVAGGREGDVALIALDTDRVTRRIHGVASPSDLMFGRDGELLFVADSSEDLVRAFDVKSGALVDEIALAEGPADGRGVQALTRTPGGQIGFALHGQSGRVSIIDLRARQQVATVDLPGPATQAFPTANSLYLLVPNERDRSVSMLSSWTLGEVDRLPGAAGVSGINAGMFDTVAFVLSRSEDKAVILDLDRRRQLGEIVLPSRPETGVTAAAGTKLYVALSGTDRVAVIDMRSRALVTMIDGVGDQPWGVNLAGGLSYCH